MTQKSVHACEMIANYLCKDSADKFSQIVRVSSLQEKVRKKFMRGHLNTNKVCE